MPAQHRPPQGGRGDQGQPRSSLQRTVFPLPESAANALADLGRTPPIPRHPHYDLLRAVRWIEGWQFDPPRGSDRGSKKVKEVIVERTCATLNEAAAMAGHAQERRQSWIDPLVRVGRARCLKLTARTDLVIHLSSAGPLELGLALHHVYGFPILPATSLKGLARATAREGDGNEALYGRQEACGRVAILDGFPVRYAAQPDIMTPHFKSWYEGKPGAPDDTENPVPIGFISIAAGAVFEVPLLARDPDTARADLDQVENDLRRGVEERGLGAKTAAGYGVFAIDRIEARPDIAESPTPSLATDRDEGSTKPEAAPPERPLLDSATIQYQQRLEELRALRCGDAGRIAEYRDWCLLLTDTGQQREAAKLIVEKMTARWIKEKARKKPKWMGILEILDKP